MYNTTLLNILYQNNVILLLFCAFCHFLHYILKWVILMIACCPWHYFISIWFSHLSKQRFQTFILFSFVFNIAFIRINFYFAFTTKSNTVLGVKCNKFLFLQKVFFPCTGVLLSAAFHIVSVHSNFELKLPFHDELHFRSSSFTIFFS